MAEDFALKALVRRLSESSPSRATPLSRVECDFSRILSDPKALHRAIGMLMQRYIGSEITHILALPGQGCLLGALLAYQLNLPLVSIGSPEDIPEHERLVLPDTDPARPLAIRKDQLVAGDRVLLFDGVIATGTTFIAASTLVRQQNANISEVAAIADFPDYGGRQRLLDMEIPAFSLMAFDADEL